MERLSYQSPMGNFVIAARGGKIVELLVETDEVICNTDAFSQPVLLLAKNWLDAYFSKKTTLSLLPLAPEGTAFQQRVWQECMRVPFGQTISYGDLAKQVAALMNKPRMSAQAVGQALSKNPILLMIPCHRVVAKGGLGGFSSGLELKTSLLYHEKALD
jgi:methylated-DNA-[protein]-cysteine S-methyltransferase